MAASRQEGSCSAVKHSSSVTSSICCTSADALTVARSAYERQVSLSLKSCGAVRGQMESKLALTSYGVCCHRDASG